MWPTDNSWLANHPSSGDMFLRISDTVYTPFIGHSQGDDYVFIHGHPLNGTKFFTWGNSGPGRFMQDFLAGGQYRAGDYTELQVGPAPTQMQTFSMPKHSKLEWTEWFHGFHVNKEVLHNPHYEQAIDHITQAIQQDMPKEKVAQMDTFFKKYANQIPHEILSTGQPWGALEEKRRGGNPLAPGLTFTLPSKDDNKYVEIQPWIELLENGTFSESTLSTITPLSYQTTDVWRDLVQKSAETFGMTWLHALHLGINAAERGDVSAPRDFFNTSLQLKPTVIAARCLAVLSSNTNDAWVYYQQAYTILTTGMPQDDDIYVRLSRNLINEMAVFLLQTTWYDKMGTFLEQILPTFGDLDAVVRLQAIYYNSQKKYEATMDLLSQHCFPTYATDRSYVMTLWNNAVEGQANAKTELDKHIARMEQPIPRNIGCQKGSKYCLNYW